MRAIRQGKLQDSENSIYGNPFLRLLRREMEALVVIRRGGDRLKERQTKAELARVDRELRRLKGRIAELERLIGAARGDATEIGMKGRLRPAPARRIDCSRKVGSALELCISAAVGGCNLR